MNKYNRTLVLAATAITTLGTLPVTARANAAPPAGEAVAFTESGRYLADLPGRDGMTTMTAAARLSKRWPTALALVAVAGCVVLVFRLSADVELAAGVATMMCVYPAAYAIGATTQVPLNETQSRNGSRCARTTAS